MLKNAVELYAKAPSAVTRDSIDPSMAGKGAAGSDLVAPTPTFFGSGVSQTQGKAQPKMQFDDATVTKALK